MKHKGLLLIGTLIVTLAVQLVFGVGNALATTGCFLDTNGHWAETFICWMKDNAITSGTGGGNYSPDNNVTRGEMAVFMQKLDELAVAQANSADAANLVAARAYTDTSLSTGQILISSGFGNWHPFNSTDPLSYTYFSSQTQVTRSSAGSSFLSVNPDLPTVLYGRSLSFKGVQFCFDTFASTTLNYVEINTYTHTTGSLGRNLRFSDPTARTGNQCRLYMLASPVTLTANDGVNFFIQVNWSVAASQFAIGRTTFILEPTTTIAVAPVAPLSLESNQETPLSPAPDTSAP